MPNLARTRPQPRREFSRGEARCLRAERERREPVWLQLRGDSVIGLQIRHHEWTRRKRSLQLEHKPTMTSNPAPTYIGEPLRFREDTRLVRGANCNVGDILLPPHRRERLGDRTRDSERPSESRGAVSIDVVPPSCRQSSDRQTYRDVAEFAICDQSHPVSLSSLRLHAIAPTMLHGFGFHIGEAARLSTQD